MYIEDAFILYLIYYKDALYYFTFLRKEKPSSHTHTSGRLQVNCTNIAFEGLEPCGHMWMAKKLQVYAIIELGRYTNKLPLGCGYIFLIGERKT